MKLTIKIFSLLLFFAIGHCAFAQKQEKIFYSKDWKITTESNAAYYRLVTFDENKKPVGTTRDYYITGELQWEGELSYIDKYDNSKDTINGSCTWYHKNGKKSRISTMINNKEDGLTTYWYESGQKQREENRKIGKLHGNWIDYYESGKIRMKAEFKDGKVADKWYMECDEYEKCQKVFSEGFISTENSNEWKLINSETYTSEIIPWKGLLMKSKSDEGYAQYIHLPFDITKNFSIETEILFVKGTKNSGHGLIYGFQDWKNFYYFYISENGYYKIGAVTEGLNIEYFKWTPSPYINKGGVKNLIKINKIKDKVYFSINGQILESNDFYSFRGNNLGVFNTSGKKEIYIVRVVVRQDIDESQTFSANSSWKGNGTGFVIDTKGYIATNYHVIENAHEIEIDLIQNGQKSSYKAKVISSDKQNDLAVIKIDDAKFKSYSKLPYNFITQISDVGTNIFALGYPMALSTMGEEVKFTDGKISSKTGFQGDVTTYQISVPVQPGNSGGPLFDYDGNIVGVVNAKIMAADNVAYAIKSSYLKNLIDVLPEILNLPNDNSIATKPLTEKIKALSDYVVLIKVK